MNLKKLKKKLKILSVVLSIINFIVALSGVMFFNWLGINVWIDWNFPIFIKLFLTFSAIIVNIIFQLVLVVFFIKIINDEKDVG